MQFRGLCRICPYRHRIAVTGVEAFRQLLHLLCGFTDWFGLEFVQEVLGDPGSERVQD